MPYSKLSILIVEDDSHTSRVVRNHIHEKYPNIRVEIAGSATKARQVCSKFPPTIIIWDGSGNEHGTREEYIEAIPDDQWARVIPISTEQELQEAATKKGSHPPIPKRMDALNHWSEDIASFIKPLLSKKKKK